MENWKKALVVVAFLATIGGLVATQYVRVNTKVAFAIDTKHALYQLAARDPAVTNSVGSFSGDSSYILDNESGAYYIVLGTWGMHTEFTTTAAFLIANAATEMIKIKEVHIYKSDGTEVTTALPIDIYLHADPDALADSDTISVKYYDHSTGTIAEGSLSPGPIYLKGVSQGYTTTTLNGNTYYWLVLEDSEGSAYANWTEDSQGSGDYIYVANSTTPNGGAYPSGGITNYVADGLATTTSSAASFCWVQITVYAEGVTNKADYTDYVIKFVVEVVQT